MRDGVIAQSGKYVDLLKPGTQLETLVTAHNEAMQLVESDSTTNLAKESILDAPVEVCDNSLNKS